MEINVKLQPFRVPNYALAESKPGLKHDGHVESQKWHLEELSISALSELCDKFRKDAFAKADKIDPR